MGIDGDIWGYMGIYSVCVCACMHACMRACVRTCVCVCVRVYFRFIPCGSSVFCEKVYKYKYYGLLYKYICYFILSQIKKSETCQLKLKTYISEVEEQGSDIAEFIKYHWEGGNFSGTG